MLQQSCQLHRELSLLRLLDISPSKLLLLQAGSTNLTSINQANAAQEAQAPVDYNVSAYDNYIYNAFLFPVNKADALSYLDSGGPLPERFAKVIAIRGANTPPDVMEYKVHLSLLLFCSEGASSTQRNQ